MATDKECDKHSDCMERIHESIHKIELATTESSSEVRGFVTAINEFVVAVRKDLYSKGGVIESVGKHANQLTLQWGMLGALIVAVLVAWFKK